MDVKAISALSLLSVLLCLPAGNALAAQQQKQQGGASTIDSASSTTVDEHERLHLVFMREEEKLARDVYITLGMQYPYVNVFGNIVQSEERHTCSVCDKLQQYGITDPVTNNNVGVFSGEEFGVYFTEKFQQLTDRGTEGELEALYVGAYIEELDMIDIRQCPAVIVETIDSVEAVSDCGKVYTDNADIQRLYDSLLEGSESHLRAYVKKIEQRIGEGNYQAQVLSQESIDAILGR